MFIVGEGTVWLRELKVRVCGLTAPCGGALGENRGLWATGSPWRAAGGWWWKGCTAWRRLGATPGLCGGTCDRWPGPAMKGLP